MQNATMEKRTQAERREVAEHKMLKAAVKLVTQKGLAGLTLNDVGEAAGYSRGLPAHYFKRKDTLITKLGAYIVECYSEGLTKEGIFNPEDGIEAVLKPADYYLKSVERDPVTMRALLVLLTEASGHTNLLSAMIELNKTSAQRFADRIRHGQKLKEIRADIDPEAEGVLILGQLRGTAAQWLLDPENISMEILRKTLQVSLRRSLEA